jgi:hypothetical protein
MIAPMPSRAGSPTQWQSKRRDIDTVGEIGRTCTQSYNLFPNLVVPLNQFVIPPIQFWPNGPDRCRVETWTMAPDWGDGDGPDMWTDDHGERPNRVLREDIEMSEAIQSNLAAGGRGGIPLSYQEARLYYWHQSADALIGSSDVPEGLRVQPVIGADWVYPNDPRLD